MAKDKNDVLTKANRQLKEFAKIVNSEHVLQKVKPDEKLRVGGATNFKDFIKAFSKCG